MSRRFVSTKDESMQCSGCGLKVPFAGKVCPYCLRDKSRDQGRHMLVLILALPLAWGGAHLFGFWGSFGGIVVAVVTSAILIPGESKPPEILVIETEGGNKRHD